MMFEGGTMKEGDWVKAKVSTMFGTVEKGDVGVVTQICGNTVDADFDGGSATFSSDELSKIRNQTLVKPIMRTRLPYGMWTCADGSEVLFNRNYNPIWKRKSHDAPAVQVDKWEWVNHTKEQWFFDDWNTPWRNKKVLEKCEGILKEWGAE